MCCFSHHLKPEMIWRFVLEIYIILHLILHQILTLYYNIGSVIGALALSSMTSSRIFLDSDVKATRDYLTW